MDAPEELLFEGHPAVLPTIGAVLLAILTLGIYALVRWTAVRGVRYRVTTQRVVVERGLLSKHMEQVDLYRLVDYQVDRSLGARLLGTGTLVLSSTDKSTPEVRLEGIRADVMQLYERVRAATEAEKRRRGVRLLDVETP